MGVAKGELILDDEYSNYYESWGEDGKSPDESLDDATSLPYSGLGYETEVLFGEDFIAVYVKDEAAFKEHWKLPDSDLRFEFDWMEMVIFLSATSTEVQRCIGQFKSMHTDQKRAGYATQYVSGARFK